MPVRKFRSLEEAADDLVVDRDDPRLVQRLGWVLQFSARLAPACPHPVGVQKYRSLDEAQAARDQSELAESGVERLSALATLLDQVAAGDRLAGDVLKAIKATDYDGLDWRHEPFDCIFHLLQHFAADEDIRATDPQYADRQIRQLRARANELRQSARVKQA